jgi:hypothetical protein
MINAQGGTRRKGWWGVQDSEGSGDFRPLPATCDQLPISDGKGDRRRTNLWKGEEQTSTPATSYYGEVQSQAGESWSWLKDKAGYVADEASALVKLGLLGGGVVVAWKLVDYFREQQGRQVSRSASGVERQLNASLARAAKRRDARPRARRSQPRKVRLDDTELHTWSERDRAHVELRDRQTGETIVEWWDDDVQQAIEDGFLPHFAPDTALHRAAFEYAKHVGVITEPRDAGRAERYSIQLTRGELEALSWLSGRYSSAKAFVDGLNPLDDSADRALGREFDRNEGPYRFQIRASDVRKTLRATASDGGDYGAIPNLRSSTVDWVLSQEWSRAS